MGKVWNEIVWGQFGAAIEALERAMHACPDELWDDRSKRHEFWYMVYHTLFWLDYYLEEGEEGFQPPAPFGLEELDPAGVIPERPYTKDELQTYLEHCRDKCRAKMAALTDEKAARRFRFGKVDLSVGQLHLYNMRHVQHHAAQLNLLLRQEIDSSPGWVFTAKTGLDDE